MIYLFVSNVYFLKIKSITLKVTRLVDMFDQLL